MYNGIRLVKGVNFLGFNLLYHGDSVLTDWFYSIEAEKLTLRLQFPFHAYSPRNSSLNISNAIYVYLQIIGEDRW